MKKKKRSAHWVAQHIQDPYVKRAQLDGYRSRAAYKLEEINTQYRCIRPGQLIVDLGAAPGSWTQYVISYLSSGTAQRQTTQIIAVDLLAMDPLPGVHCLQGDFREENTQKALLQAVQPPGRKIDTLLSDMAPNLCGIPLVDAMRIHDLAEHVLEFSQRHLHPQGTLLLKNFHGSHYSQTVQQFKTVFQTVLSCKPQASRNHSAEVYLLANALKIKRDT